MQRGKEVIVMLETARKSNRNQAVDCLRLLSAVLVVFLHVPFPEKAGEAVQCLARMAVPLFFMLSGFYSVTADGKQLKKRLIRLTWLNLGATALYFVWGCCTAGYWGGTVRDHLEGIFSDSQPLWQFLFLHVNPFAGHLWYLTALMCCNFVLWLYRRTEKARRNAPLYCLGGILLVVFFVLSELLPGKVHYYCYRNGWIMGLPMFLLGLLLGEYKNQFTFSDGKLWLAAAGGMLLSLVFQRRFGQREAPLSSILTACALLLLADRHPRLPLPEKILSHLGGIATSVYVEHVLFWEAYMLMLQPYFPGRFKGMEPWARPIVVLMMSLVAAVIWEWIREQIKRK